MSLKAEPIILTPESVGQTRISQVSQSIIDKVLKSGEVDVIGLSTAMFLSATAVNFSKAIANVHVKRLYVDYLPTPIGRFEAMYLTVERGPAQEEDKIAKIEADMDLRPGAQTVLVSKMSDIQSLTMACLVKFQQFQRVRIAGAGSTINKVVTAALQISKGGISKDPVGIVAIKLETLQKPGTNPSTALAIYLEKGKETVQDEYVKTLEDEIKNRLGKY